MKIIMIPLILSIRKAMTTDGPISKWTFLLGLERLRWEAGSLPPSTLTPICWRHRADTHSWFDWGAWLGTARGHCGYNVALCHWPMPLTIMIIIKVTKIMIMILIIIIIIILIIDIMIIIIEIMILIIVLP